MRPNYNEYRHRDHRDIFLAGVAVGGAGLAVVVVTSVLLAMLARTH